MQTQREGAMTFHRATGWFFNTIFGGDLVFILVVTCYLLLVSEEQLSVLRQVNFYVVFGFVAPAFLLLALYFAYHSFITSARKEERDERMLQVNTLLAWTTVLANILFVGLLLALR